MFVEIDSFPQISCEPRVKDGVVIISQNVDVRHGNLCFRRCKSTG